MRSFRWSNTPRSLSSRRPCILVWLFVFLTAATIWAKERAYHVFDQSDGFPVSSLSGFTQDTNGFFWFGTAAGLYRFDGVEFRRWAKDKISGWFYQVFAGPNGEVLVTSLPDATLYRVLPNEDAEIVIGPEEKPFANVHDAEFTTNGRLWVSRLDALFYRNDSRQWVIMPEEIRGNDRIWNLSASLDGALWVATTHSIWKIYPDLSYKKILTRSFNGYIGNVIAHPDGSFFYMEKYPDGGKIFQWRDGQVTERISLKTNLHYFLLRGQTVWASGDRYLIAFRPDRPPEVLEAGKDAPIGGWMVLDHEGSLWTSNGRDLFQMPEPETEIWTPREGLPKLATIALTETEEGIWLSTWSGLGHLARGADWRAFDDHLMHQGQLCSDGLGSLWLYDFHDFWERRHGKFIRHRQQTRGVVNGCDSAPDGAVWMSTNQGIWRLRSGQSPKLVSRVPAYDLSGNVLEDSKGRLWFTVNEDICHAPATLKTGQPVDWSCETIKGARAIGKPIELADGDLWLGTDNLGILRYTREQKWESIPASLQLISRKEKPIRSPSGGAWILGVAGAFRVLPRPDLPDGWQVVEQLSNLQGIPAGGIADLIEASDGGLWLAASTGIAHLPASARFPRLEPPRVKLIDLSINGQRVNSTMSLHIPPGRNQIEVRFAALSYRDRSRLRYQYKLHNNDPWTEAGDSLPLFRFYDLGAGKYTVEIRASLDGVNWSSAPATIGFEVLSPWYLRWWAMDLFGLVVAIILFVWHRMRVRVLLQLERQRTRIAMDLHDEIGSGLGSIGILSSVAASQTISEEQRLEMSIRIAETADELGTSLTDIVWSLRTDVTTLESLAFHLTRRAESLFANYSTQLSTKFPDDWQSINLSLAARRNVLLIAVESLHNVAKHAQAKNVTMLFAPAAESKWLMRIEDDGCGFSNSDGNNGSGMGMQTMQRRAEEIGAQLSITSKNGRGSVVSLTFNPQAKERG
jgi:ligand-binding sensor domain-containing protein/two-component sensor histidine kinase